MALNDVVGITSSAAIEVLLRTLGHRAAANLTEGCRADCERTSHGIRTKYNAQLPLATVAKCCETHLACRILVTARV